MRGTGWNDGFLRRTFFRLHTIIFGEMRGIRSGGGGYLWVMYCSDGSKRLDVRASKDSE
jgi:hypothetical protein